MKNMYVKHAHMKIPLYVLRRPTAVTWTHKRWFSYLKKIFFGSITLLILIWMWGELLTSRHAGQCTCWSGCSHMDPGRRLILKAGSLESWLSPPSVVWRWAKCLPFPGQSYCFCRTGLDSRSGSMKYLVHVKFLIHSLAPKSYFSFVL